MDEKSKPYRVEAQRITHKIENGEDFNPDDYDYIFNVEKLSDDLTESSDDYLIRKINGVCYRFDYRVPSDNGNSVLLFNIIFSAAALLIFGVLLYVYFSIIRPFETLSKKTIISADLSGDLISCVNILKKRRLLNLNCKDRTKLLFSHFLTTSKLLSV